MKEKLYKHQWQMITKATREPQNKTKQKKRNNQTTTTNTKKPSASPKNAQLIKQIRSYVNS